MPVSGRLETASQPEHGVVMIRFNWKFFLIVSSLAALLVAAGTADAFGQKKGNKGQKKGDGGGKQEMQAAVKQLQSQLAAANQRFIAASAEVNALQAKVSAAQGSIDVASDEVKNSKSDAELNSQRIREIEE